MTKFALILFSLLLSTNSFAGQNLTFDQANRVSFFNHVGSGLVFSEDSFDSNDQCVKGQVEKRNLENPIVIYHVGPYRGLNNSGRYSETVLIAEMIVIRSVARIGNLEIGKYKPEWLTEQDFKELCGADYLQEVWFGDRMSVHLYGREEEIEQIKSIEFSGTGYQFTRKFAEDFEAASRSLTQVRGYGGSQAGRFIQFPKGQTDLQRFEQFRLESVSDTSEATQIMTGVTAPYPDELLKKLATKK